MRSPDETLADLVDRLARSLALAGEDGATAVSVGGAREGRWIPLGVSRGRALWAVADREGRIGALIAGPAQTTRDWQDATLADAS